MDLNDLIQTLQHDPEYRGTNAAAAPSLYTHPEILIQQYLNPLDPVTGYVTPEISKRIAYINSFSPKLTRTALHEAAHIQQQQANTSLTPWTSPLGARSKLNQLSQMRETKFPRWALNSFSNLNELLANMQTEESEAPEGVTVWQTDRGRQLNNIFNKDWQHYLDQKMFPHVSHMYDDTYFRKPEFGEKYKNINLNDILLSLKRYLGLRPF